LSAAPAVILALSFLSCASDWAMAWSTENNTGTLLLSPLPPKYGAFNDCQLDASKVTFNSEWIQCIASSTTCFLKDTCCLQRSITIGWNIMSAARDGCCFESITSRRGPTSNGNCRPSAENRSFNAGFPSASTGGWRASWEHRLIKNFFPEPSSDEFSLTFIPSPPVVLTRTHIPACGRKYFGELSL